MPEVFSNRTDIESDIWLKDVTFDMGAVYLVEANSGTGKSSLCSYIYGYRNDYRGTILFDGSDTARYKTRQWVEVRQRHISLLWQELRLFPELTAWENVAIKNHLTHFQNEATITSWFERLGIADKRSALIERMSFGQQQRVAMIRALCQPFNFLFLDEPISHLDDTNSDIMRDIAMEEALRQGAGVIITSIGKHINTHYHQIFRL